MADWDAGDDWDAPKNGGDDWDAPAAGGGLTDKWDGEDEDEGTLLGDDWDEDPAEKETETKVIPGEKKLTKRQLAKKKEEEEIEAAKKRAEIRAKMSDPAEIAKEKARVKRAIEASNQQLTADLFGGEGYEAPEGGEFVNEQLDQDNLDMQADIPIETLEKMKVKEEEPLDDVVLKTVEDYKKLGKRVAGIAAKDKKAKFLQEFLKACIDEATLGMKLDDCTVIKKHVNVLCNKKQKDEAGKKKKANTKKALNSGRGNDYDDYGYDDGMMDDFL